jgi:hypothetical protein
MIATQETHHPQSAPAGDASVPVTVAVAVPLAPDRLQATQAALGPGLLLVDIRRAPTDAAVVIVPPCSPGTLRAVMRTFPKAQVLVVEPDGDLGAGPISRALGAGASAYVRTAEIGGLAASVRWARERLPA